MLVIDVSAAPASDRVDLLEAAAAFPEIQFEKLRNKRVEVCGDEQTRCKDMGNNASVPCCVRQQTRDVAAGLIQVNLFFLIFSGGGGANSQKKP